MSLLDRLERRLQFLAVEHVTLHLTIMQGLVLVIALARPEIIQKTVLLPEAVRTGHEFWRLFTFLITPPSVSLLTVFGLYLFYIMGTALEHHWGAFRYNLFLLVGYFATVAVAFLTLQEQATNIFIGGSVFLAFAWLYPTYTLNLFFVLPVQIKWLALATWAWYALQLMRGPASARWMVLASSLNFLLFFGRDVVRWATGPSLKRAAKKARPAPKAFHTCATCGITDATHPKMDFRYCPGCAGGLAYCEAHLNNHEHRTASGSSGD